MNASMKELLDADWARLAKLSGRSSTKRTFRSHFTPRFLPVVLIRLSVACETGGWRRLAQIFSLMNFVLFGIEVPTRVRIGPGLILTHTQGTVLGPAAIGCNATIFQQVTLGAREADFSYDLTTRPTIGDNVTLTAGAKVIGPVTVGDGALVAANAVVLCDVPPGALAVGVPAVIRLRDDAGTPAQTR